MTGNHHRTWLLTLLDEAFGMSDAASGYFLDAGRAGLLAALDGVGAEEASRAAFPGAATLAAHCGHVRYHLRVFAAYLRGEEVKPDWAESWRTRTVDGPAWDALRVSLREAHGEVTAAVRGVEAWTEHPVADSLILLAHTAYHLGAIRQLLLAVRAEARG